MQSRLLINLLLVSTIILLGIMLVVTGKQDNIDKDISLTGLSPDTIGSISILQDDKEMIAFARRDGQWWMQSPYTLPANPARLNTLLKLPAAHSYAQFDRDGLDLKRFGLDQPHVSIIFNETRIDFGIDNPLDRSRYVMAADQVHLINDSLYEQLQAPATFFLDARLLPAHSTITRLVLPDYEISKSEGHWLINPDAGINEKQIAAIIEAWQDISAITLNAYENTNTDMQRITVSTEQSGDIDFYIVSPAPSLVLARSDTGIQYHISGYDTDSLFPNPEKKATGPQ